jgi:hypothetical protein
MLLVANTSVEQNRQTLAKLLRQELVPNRLEVRRGTLHLHMDRWRDFWRPARPFFEVDEKLAQRLNRLKRTWELLIQRPDSLIRQRYYAWRYFGLLHHSLTVARRDRGRRGAIEAIERILGFESFLCEASEEAGLCAGAVSNRHPVSVRWL